MASEILTVGELAEWLKVKPSSVYGMSRHRGQVRMAHPLPVLRLPCGLRFRRADIEAWLEKVATPEE